MIKEIILKKFEFKGLIIEPSKVKITPAINLYRFVLYDPHDTEYIFGTYLYKTKNYHMALRKFKKDFK